jgi:hypothetical protein
MIASIIRKLILRGRTSEGWFSAESWQTAPDEPQPKQSARRAQHFRNPAASAGLSVVDPLSATTFVMFGST